LEDVGVPRSAKFRRGVASGLLISQATGGARGETESEGVRENGLQVKKHITVGNNHRRAEENGLERENVR